MSSFLSQIVIGGPEAGIAALGFAAQWGYTMHRIAALEKEVRKLARKQEVEK